MKKTDPPIIVEQTFKASIEKTWNAITESHQMKKWFFKEIESFQAEEGFETEFLVELEDRKFPHIWKVMEVVPNQKIKCNWQYGGYPGESIITFDLIKIADGTKLTVTAEAIEDFPSDIPEFKRESGVAGWEYFIQNSLKAYLENN